jgi:hypothetical protein
LKGTYNTSSARKIVYQASSILFPQVLRYLIVTMQTLRDIGTKFHNLSVNTTSKHPTAEDSAQIDTTLFEEGDVSPSPRSREKEHKLITNVIVKHSSAFNSERASGMNKLQQLQFIEALKKIILGVYRTQ